MPLPAPRLTFETGNHSRTEGPKALLSGTGAPTRQALRPSWVAFSFNFYQWTPVSFTDTPKPNITNVPG